MIISVRGKASYRLDKPRCRDRAKNTDIFSSRKPDRRAAIRVATRSTQLPILELLRQDKASTETEREIECSRGYIIGHEQEKERNGERVKRVMRMKFARVIHRNARDCMPIRLRVLRRNSRLRKRSCVAGIVESDATVPDAIRRMRRAIGANAFQVSKDCIDEDREKLDRACINRDDHQA